MLFDTVLAFDHVRHRILIIANARITGDEDLESLYQFACAKIEFVERELERALSKAPRSDAAALEVTSNVSREQFEQMVRTAKEYIAAGDIYQVVLSQRFEASIDADPFTVYRALRHVNPSPYMYFLRIGGRSIVGSSPEMLVRVEGRRVETHPIAGTRPRGRNEEEDMRLAEELKRNEKERAEHVMLVDLGRNDVGRVAEYGSVRVPTYMTLERYSHVMHLVSIVEGKLDERARSAGCARRLLSGGHRVGRAEGAGDGDHRGAGEPTARRLRRRRGLSRLRRQSRLLHHDSHGRDRKRAAPTCRRAPGIVADSNPAAEYEETRDKARAVIRALELAQAGLVMILVIDNYDSFTYNLVQYLGELGADVRVRRNDQVTIGEDRGDGAGADRDLARARADPRTPASRRT